MPKHSAGLLVYRKTGGRLEILLVHPGGPLYKDKDDGVWSIPKGEVDPGEDMLEAAKREFKEETGFEAPGPFVPLSEIVQKSGKIVHAWATPGDFDPEKMKSNPFSMEWPPRSGKTQEFPEVDRAAWFTAEQARGKVLSRQAALVDELEKAQR